MTALLQHKRLVLGTVFFCIACVLLGLFYRNVQPVFSEGRAQFNGETTQRVTFPYQREDAPQNFFQVSVRMTIPQVHPTVYVVSADDCVEELQINGAIVEGLPLPYCDYWSGVAVDLGPLLHVGVNDVVIKAGNGGGAASAFLRPSSTDAVILSIKLLFILSFLLFGLFLYGAHGARERWRCNERVLLWVFLGCHVWLLWQTLGAGRGFDVFAHTEMLGIATLNPLAPIRGTFLSYHPPLGFLLARGISLLGIDPLISVEVTSSLASLVAFFFLRATLGRLGILRSFLGVTFLYIASGIPLQVYLASSLNLDVIILALTSIVLYLSIRLFWGDGEKKQWKKDSLAVLLILALIAALLVKFSGILLLPIPLLVMLAGSGRRSSQGWWVALATVVIAVTLTSPYYLLRYFRQEGILFPSNADVVLGEELVTARVYRDLHMEKFFFLLFVPDCPFFFPRGADMPDFHNHNYETPRFADTWKDFWIADYNPLFQTRESSLVSLRYLQIAPWLLLLGFALWLWSFLRKRGAEEWLGFILLAIALLFLLALTKYVYDYPHAPFKPTKGIYIAPAMWGVAYALSLALCRFPRILVLPALQRAYERLLLVLVVVFLFLNHLLPIY